MDVKMEDIAKALGVYSKEEHLAERSSEENAAVRGDLREEGKGRMIKTGEANKGGESEREER